jgi:Carbohydrate binding domain.
MTRTEALRIRQMIEDTAALLPDDDAVERVILFPVWKTNVTYHIGDRFRYNGTLYKVVQDHTSHEAYTPNVTVSLYAEVLPGQDGEIGDWVQPDSTNPYMKGDKVRHNGKVWISTIDYNVSEPGIAGWEEVV